MTSALRELPLSYAVLSEGRKVRLRVRGPRVESRWSPYRASSLPFAEPRRHLDTIPGINTRTAEVVIAEIGVDMSRFPSEHHLASWAGLCPGNNESAGKHKAEG